MARLVEVARESGISERVGLVLHENKPMLNLCRKLGFCIAPEPNDATVLRFENRWLPCNRARLLSEARLLKTTATQWPQCADGGHSPGRGRTARGAPLEAKSC
jgi:hypothetical protein